MALERAAAREADEDDHIEILNSVQNAEYDNDEAKSIAKKNALVSVAHTIVRNGSPAGALDLAKKLEGKYDARNNDFDVGTLENDYSDLQAALKPMGGRRRRRGKKSRKGGRKSRSSRKAKRYTRRR